MRELKATAVRIILLNFYDYVVLMNLEVRVCCIPTHQRCIWCAAVAASPRLARYSTGSKLKTSSSSLPGGAKHGGASPAVGKW